MKASTTFALLVLSLSACVQNHQEKLDEKNAPYEHFYFQRSFPQETLDFAAMEKSMKAARRFASQGLSKDSDTEWVQEGPYNIGGRINCIAIHPDDSETFLTGTAGGGVYRTTDGGESWDAITDELSHLPIGDVVYDPTDANTIYVGTGDVNIGGTVHIGNGLYRSTDAGETWEHLGLEDSRIISKVVINPEDPNQIFVGTMGIPFERNEDRGLYRSNDGGENWEQILYVSDDSGIIDLVMNPDDPNVLYAANWNRIRTNLESEVSGPEAGVYKTIDGGDTWTQLTNGLPEGNLSRIGLQVYDSNPDVVFAVVVDEGSNFGGLYKSSNAGDSFEAVPVSDEMAGVYSGFGWYFAKIGLNPNDENELSILGVNMYSTIDGGENWFMSTPEWWTYEVHADKHDLEYTSEGDILLATDGGLYKCEEGDFVNWTDIDFVPNTQFYRVATDPFQAGVIYGGAQDNGTSANITGDPDVWERIFGGDGFTPIPDHTNPQFLYTTTQNGNFYCIDYNWGDIIGLSESFPVGMRTNWDSPIIMDPNDNTVLYSGRDRVFKMENAPFGFWEEISPVLVNPSEEFYNRRNVSALDQSAVSDDILYAGTSDGMVWSTTDGGDNWNEVIEDLPEYYVTSIKASPFTENEVIVCLSGYRDNDETPHLYRSSDNGNNWEAITGDLPIMPINDVVYYSETTYFIATDNGVYYTENSGENWLRAGINMPFIVVLDLAIDHIGNRLVAATFAQSMYSIDLLELLDSTDGLAENEAIEVSVYPNPVQSELRFQLESQSNIEWDIFDLQGKSVLRGSWITAQNPSISVVELPSGTYVFKGTDGKETYTSTFVVSR